MIPYFMIDSPQNYLLRNYKNDKCGIHSYIYCAQTILELFRKVSVASQKSHAKI